MVNIRGYELPTNLQNFTQKDLTEVKIFQKVLGGYFFPKHPVDHWSAVVTIAPHCTIFELVDLEIWQCH